MSTAPNGKVTHAVGAGGGRVAPTGSVDKSAAKSVDKGSAKSLDHSAAAKSLDQSGAAGKKLKPKMTRDQRTQMIVVSVAALIVFAIGIGVYAYFHTPEAIKPGDDRVDAPDEKFVPFVISPEFEKLPFRRQKILLEEIAGRKEKIEAMHASGQMKQETYQDALAYCWIGKGLKQMDHYYSLGSKEQDDYIQKLVDKEIASPPKAKEHKKSEAKVKSLLERFPSEEKEEFKKFQKIVEKAEKVRKQEGKDTGRQAISGTTRPTTRPGTPPAGAAPAHKPPTGPATPAASPAATPTPAR